MLDPLVFGLGLALAVSAITSALRAFILPRGASDWLARRLFLSVRFLFDLYVRRLPTYPQRDAVMALYAPLSLMALLAVWLSFVLAGYTCMFWAIGVRPAGDAFALSGSSLFTLGSTAPPTLPATALTFTEAAMGLTLVALLIAYLPIMYTAFQRREEAVTMLEVRAGSPPSAVEMIIRYHNIQGFDRLSEVWAAWEVWFVNLEESHTSLSPLVFFRSPQSRRSWITAAGAVLDAASLVASTVDLPRDPVAELCIRAGYLALREIARFFRIPFDPDPKPDDPISVTRAEYDAAYDQLVAAGVPVKPDREQAWRDFAGWRVNYDTVLVALAFFVMAPEAPWSSDRSPRIRPRVRI